MQTDHVGVSSPGVVTPPRKKCKRKNRSKALESSKNSKIKDIVPGNPRRIYNVDIMGLHCERVILSIIFSMRVLCSGWKIWAADRCPVVSSDTLKRIASWYTVTVVPTIAMLTLKHRRPPFARRVFEEGVNAFGNTPNGLHIILLHNASKDIMKKCYEGVGSTTMAEVKRWFSLMSTTKQSSLFQLAPSIAQTEFQSGLSSHGSKLESYRQGKTEYPFFNPEGLFIQIAHMVWYYTTSSLPGGLPGITELCRPKIPSMKEWERSSGDLFCTVFELDSHGLPVTFIDHTPFIPPKSIANVDLPYIHLQDDSTIHSKKPISLSSLHYKNQELFKEEMISRCDDGTKPLWKREYNKVLAYMNMMLDSNESHDLKVESSEKQGRSYRRRHPGSTPNHPANFPRDVFLLGDKSYHLGFKDKETKPSRSESQYRSRISFPRSEYV